MPKKIFIGSLSVATTEAALMSLFRRYGAVTSVKMGIDRNTNRPSGTAIAEMPIDGQGLAAIAGLNNTNIGGKVVTVNEATAAQLRDI